MVVGKVMSDSVVDSIGWRTSLCLPFRWGRREDESVRFGLFGIR